MNAQQTEWVKITLIVEHQEQLFSAVPINLCAIQKKKEKKHIYFSSNSMKLFRLAAEINGKIMKFRSATIDFDCNLQNGFTLVAKEGKKRIRSG